MRGASFVPGLLFVTMAACGLDTKGGAAIDQDGAGGDGAGGSVLGSGAGGSKGPGGTTSGGAAPGGMSGGGAGHAGVGGASKAGAGGAKGGAGGTKNGGQGGTDACGSACKATEYCSSSGACVPTLSGGEQCSEDTQCGAASKYCTQVSSGQKVCCDQQSCGQCYTCSTGQCVPVAVDTSCPADQPGDACPAKQHCDAMTHKCLAHAPVGSTCGPAQCSSDGTQVQGTSACDAGGKCMSGTASQECAPYRCLSATATCGSTCTPQTEGTDCANGLHCVNGACGPYLDNGANCDATSPSQQCSSNHCVDGVCCNTDCTGACQSCLVGTKGTCSNAAAGTDPRGMCEPIGDPSTCGRNKCDGGTDCPQPKTKDTPCGDNSKPACLNGDTGAFKCDDGGGNCDFVGSPGTCTGNYSCPYTTTAGACPTSCMSNQDCANGLACASDHTCQTAKLPIGTKCPSGNGGDCTSGVCIKNTNNDLICAAKACPNSTGGACQGDGKATLDGTGCDPIVGNACCAKGNTRYHTGTCGGPNTCNFSGGQDTCPGNPGSCNATNDGCN